MTTDHLDKKLTAIRLCYGGEPEQFGDLYLPAHQSETSDLNPVMILIHGGYWKDNHDLNTYATSQLIPSLVSSGWAVWNIEYRRMDSMGANIKAPWPTVFADVAAAIDSLRLFALKHLLDIQNVSVIGHSAGGCLALWAANRRKISATSPLFTPTPTLIKKALSIGGVLNLTHPEDLCQPEQVERLMGGSVTDLPERYRDCDPSQLFDTDVRTLVIHGENDKTVSIQQALRYADAAPNTIDLEIWPEADHFSMLPHKGIWNEQQWIRLNETIQRFFIKKH